MIYVRKLPVICRKAVQPLTPIIGHRDDFVVANESALCVYCAQHAVLKNMNDHSWPWNSLVTRGLYAKPPCDRNVTAIDERKTTPQRQGWTSHPNANTGTFHSLERSHLFCVSICGPLCLLLLLYDQVQAKWIRKSINLYLSMSPLDTGLICFLKQNVDLEKMSKASC
jgi:hypothetical protein